MAAGAVTVRNNGDHHYDVGGTVTIVSTPGDTAEAAGISATGGSGPVPAVWDTNGQTFTIPISTLVPTTAPNGTYAVTTVSSGAAHGPLGAENLHWTDSYEIIVACPQVGTPAVIAPHGPVTTEATGPNGAVVTYTSPATSDDADPPGVATCIPASGTLLPLGATVIKCNAIDSDGNHSLTTKFTATVVDTTAPVIAAHRAGWRRGDRAGWRCRELHVSDDERCGRRRRRGDVRASVRRHVPARADGCELRCRGRGRQPRPADAVHGHGRRHDRARDRVTRSGDGRGNRSRRGGGQLHGTVNE